MYFRHTASCEAVIMNLKTVSEAERPLFVSSEHILHVHIHKYGTPFVDNNNLVLYRFLLSCSQTEIRCDSNSI